MVVGRAVQTDPYRQRQHRAGGSLRVYRDLRGLGGKLLQIVGYLWRRQDSVDTFSGGHRLVAVPLAVLLGCHAEALLEPLAEVPVFGIAALIGNGLQALFILQQEGGGSFRPPHIQEGAEIDAGADFHDVRQVIGADVLPRGSVLHPQGLIQIGVDVVAGAADAVELYLVVLESVAELREIAAQIVALELGDEDAQNTPADLPQRVGLRREENTGRLIFQVTAQNTHTGAVLFDGTVGKLVAVDIRYIAHEHRQIQMEDHHQVVLLLHGAEPVQLIGTGNVDVAAFHLQHIIDHRQLQAALQQENDFQHVFVHVEWVVCDADQRRLHGGMLRKGYSVVQHGG